MSSTEQVLPSSVDAEQSVLGILMSKPDESYRVTDVLKPEHFYGPKETMVYQAILDLLADNVGIDMITVSQKLKEKGLLDKVGGRLFISDLALGVASGTGLEYLADQIVQTAKARNLIKFCMTTINRVYECDPEEIPTLLATAERSINEIGACHLHNEPRSLSAIIPSVYETLEKRYEERRTGGSSLPGIPCGFGEIDEFIGGLQPGNLIICAARPSMGKTAFVLQLADFIAKIGRVPVVFSLEMDSEQLTRRLISVNSGIKATVLTNGDLDDDDWNCFHEVIVELGQSNLFIDDSNAATVSDISAKANRLKAKLGKLDLIVIDYIQLMQGASKRQKSDPNRTQEISEITRGLKLLAKFLSVPVVALSQLSRAVEMRQNKRPMMSDLRESGSIEQDADIVMFIYRDEYYNPQSSRRGEAEIIIAKNRNGEIGTVDLLWDAARTRFQSKGKRK